jgi:signal transduction histidine kinase
MAIEAKVTATRTTGPAAGADEGVRHPLRIDPHVADALLALAFTAGALVSLLARGTPAAGFKEDDALSIALVLLTTLPLALLHVQALPAYAVMLGSTVATLALRYEGSLVSTGALALALFIIAITASYRVAVIAGVSTGLLSIVGATTYVLRGGDINWGQTIFYWLAFSGLWLVGLIIKLYRESAARAQRRAALFAQDRELHDGVGHALNVVVLHAQGAQRVLETKPNLAREALASIESAGRQALTDVERMLGLLRTEEDDVLAAQPGLAQIPELAAQVTEAGLPVTVHQEGQQVTLPASLDLTAYRVVQESLTNSLKHAGNAHAAVVVRYLDGAVELEVTDTGRGAAAAPSATGGRGIPGMRERVTVFGGRLEVGPRPQGGFRVWAWFPTTAETP